MIPIPSSVISDLVKVLLSSIPHLPSLTGESRRSYFHRVITPLYSRVETAHGLYHQLCLDFGKDLLDVRTSKERQERQISNLPDTTQADLKAAMDKFLLAREKDQELRYQLRETAQLLFASIRHNEERRFLAAVCYYFIHHRAASPGDHAIDSDLEVVIEKGGVAAWDTPTIGLHNELRVQTDPQAAIDKADFLRYVISDRFMLVRKHYHIVESQVTPLP